VDKDFDIEMDEFREVFAKDQRRTRPNKHAGGSGFLAGFKPEGPHLVIGAIGALVLIFLLIFLFGGGSDVSSEEFNALKAKFDGLEKRLTTLEAIDQKLARLETQVKKLGQQSSKRSRPVASGTNKKRYHAVRQGDTLSRIAEKYGISISELCRLNDIKPKAVIRPGQKLLVASGS